MTSQENSVAAQGFPAGNVAPPVVAPSDPARRDPYFVLGIVGFALSLTGILNLVGLIISIVALVKSKRRGFTNGFALAGVIIAGLALLFTVVMAAILAPILIDAAQTCARLGDGVHVVGDSTYTCTPSSFRVESGS